MHLLHYAGSRNTKHLISSPVAHDDTYLVHDNARCCSHRGKGAYRVCGIVGFIDPLHSRDEAVQLIDDMCVQIRHRGPDDQGTWVGDGVALGMRRLAIIDLAGGRQPTFNEDQQVVVVFNGEIYNYRTLQAQLRTRGHTFQTDCDTEVIVHAYEEYGDDCVTHLAGMFAFALWDQRHQRLLLARDRFGKKPLNYYWDGKRLIFGSEIKSLLQAGIPREINPVALDEYLLYGYVPSPNTLFQSVLKLPAGHVLAYEAGQVRLHRYWDLPFEPVCHDDEVTAVARTRELLREAVRMRLMSDVPLGAFLSGGIDSSLVVGLMSELMAQPVKTFSIGFEEDGYDELPYARQVARHFGTEHHELVVRPDLVTVLPQLAWAYDEPFADPSMLPTYYVAKLAHEHVTVALSGDGGDEMFCGYARYHREMLIDRLPESARLLARRGARLMPDGIRGKAWLTALGTETAARCVQAAAVFPSDLRPTFYTPDFYVQVRHYNPYERGLGPFREAARLDVAARMQYVDTHLYLTDDILVKVDKASMFNSLETRAPLLDQNLAAYVSSLPSQLRTRRGELKYLLKKVAAEILPANIIQRRKQGFSVPLRYWFRGDLIPFARDVLAAPRARERGIFQPAFIDSMLSVQSTPAPVGDGRLLWALICLELWYQVYIDSPVLAYSTQLAR